LIGGADGRVALDACLIHASLAYKLLALVFKVKAVGRTSAKRKTKNDSGATRFSFFLNLVTGIKAENGLMA